ncbi:MAG: hypothetical protein ACOZB0_01730 [Pseudomonadota bacterium]
MFDFFRKDKGAKKPVIPDRPVTPERPAKPARAVAPERPAPTPGPAQPSPAAKPIAALAKPASAPAKPAAAPVRVAAPPAIPTAPAAAQETTSQNGFLVQEFDTQFAPEVEDAVMLYANGRTGDATAALNRFILNHPDSRDPQPWRLLFDLYEATGQRQPFEDLAMDYAVRFERSPPTWRVADEAVPSRDRPQAPTFAFGSTWAPQDSPRLENFLRECEAADSVVLDFNKTSVPSDESFARTLLDCVTRLVAAGKALRLVGGEAFVVRLNAFRADNRLSEPLWLLLLMLLQQMGKAEAFEEAALDYAIRFEMSPPSYTPPRKVAEPVPESTEAQAQAPDHTFVVPGRIGPGSTAVFDQLREFAAPLDVVEIDLGRVTQIDFTVVGVLMDAVMQLVQAGKKVSFREGNEMVCLLMQMVGVGQFANVQPRVRK